MPAKVLMIQGASSSAGKSMLTAALCRVFARKGVRVAPFKAQNMSNNAAVCADGAEIGRAQALQAAAAGIEPTADMNPVLLKPEADSRSQVVVMGRPWRTLPARRFYQCKSELWPVVIGALDRLRACHDLVLIEGAGSPVELNLRAGDIVNMALARHAQAPVLLIADIDRGGIFAQLLGTLWLLTADERALVRGLVVNKFRGDANLFKDGIGILEDRGQVPVLGVIPYLPGLALPEEDAVALDCICRQTEAASIKIAVVRLPHIANFDDFDPLQSESGVSLRYVQTPDALGQPDAVILPGTKSTMADLAWLRAQGLVSAIHELAMRGVAIVGICGGYQMLGRWIRDPDHVESQTGEAPGLGLLPVETTFVAAKVTYQATARVRSGVGWLQAMIDRDVEGYEIHMGATQGGSGWLQIWRRNGDVVDVPEGAMSDDGRIWGCYLHGIFENAQFRRAWLASLTNAPRLSTLPAEDGRNGRLEPILDRLADAVEAALDMQQLETIIGTPSGVTGEPSGVSRRILETR
jgi:adenosylcobyric acid synthase